MKISTDIDIDFLDRSNILNILPHIPAVNTAGSEQQKHISGVYFQKIPIDPTTGYATVDYKVAEDLGYFKIDFLNNSIYSNVRNENHLCELINKEPPWFLLEDPEIVAMLAHINEHFHIVDKIKPTCMEDLAVVLALIRPGKRYLLNKDRATIDQDIWLPASDGFIFKRAHSYAYAMSIIVQLNLLVEEATVNS